MPGIVVGIDGSGHSRRALAWALKEAAAHQVPATVVTVHSPAVGYLGTVSHPEDQVLTQRELLAAARPTKPAAPWSHPARQPGPRRVGQRRQRLRRRSTSAGPLVGSGPLVVRCPDPAFR